VLPPENAVAEVLTAHDAGCVVDPSNRADVASAVAGLLDQEARCRAMGQNGRRYAERAFSPEVAADRFLEVFGSLVAVPPHPVAGQVLVAEREPEPATATTAAPALSLASVGERVAS
jgi:hypothetical protein